MRFFTALAISALVALSPSLVMAQDEPDEQQSVSDEPPEAAPSDETEQWAPEQDVQQSEQQRSDEAAGELDSAEFQGAAGPRRDYAGCLRRLIRERVREGMSVEAFSSTARRACASEERAFVLSAVDDDVATGARRADAEESVSAQVRDYLNGAAYTYSSRLPQ